MDEWMKTKSSGVKNKRYRKQKDWLEPARIQTQRNTDEARHSGVYLYYHHSEWLK